MGEGAGEGEGGAGDELRRSIAELRDLLDTSAAIPVQVSPPPAVVPAPSPVPVASGAIVVEAGPARETFAERAAAVWQELVLRRVPQVAGLVLAGAAIAGLSVAALILLEGDENVPSVSSPRDRPAAPAVTGGPEDALVPGLPAAGPGVDAPGTAVAVRVEADGSVRVLEQARLSPNAVGPVRLVLPEAARLGAPAAGLSLTVADLKVAVDGAPVAPRVTGVGSWTIGVAGRGARVVASYRLVGAAAGERGIVPPLLGGPLLGTGLPLVVRGTGPRLLGATCPGTPIVCGRASEGGWTADVPDSPTPLVVLRLG